MNKNTVKALEVLPGESQFVVNVYKCGICYPAYKISPCFISSSKVKTFYISIITIFLEVLGINYASELGFDTSTIQILLSMPSCRKKSEMKSMLSRTIQQQHRSRWTGLDPNLEVVVEVCKQ